MHDIYITTKLSRARLKGKKWLATPLGTKVIEIYKRYDKILNMIQ